MVFVPGGTFRMGSDAHYKEEAPAHQVKVDGFFIDATPVTNRQFKQFVNATGHVTVAERPPDPKDYPGALPHMLFAGSLVFQKAAGPVDLRNPTEWWDFVEGANWKRPLGPKSGLFKKESHPVVHVAYEDAMAYARWAGKELPTEAEWEYAAWGGVEGAEYAWGDAFAPSGRQMANTWQGEFPHRNTLEDGFERTSPVGTFPANGYGLSDMIGNVWEWTTDWWSGRHAEKDAKSCCTPAEPARRAGGGELRRAPAGDPDTAQSGEGRLASLRAELLPPLPSRRAPRPAGGHIDEPCRLPLHQEAVTQFVTRKGEPR